MKILIRFPLLAVVVLSAFCLSAQVPVYNSYPSAPAVIFLDFDGHTVEGTSWNYTGPIYCGPSNLNAEQMTEVFNRVAEDYRPFNINVTTDSTKYWNAPPKQRTRVILTITSDWYGRAAGVAYVNSFTWGDNTPCFVFTALIGYNVKTISEVSSHEAGHTLGLNHQASYDVNCSKLSEYNYGYGDGEISWAPIMGVGYYKNFTVWHNGPNPWDCTGSQSDLEIITSATNGFGYRPDDHTDNYGTATGMPVVDNKIVASGVISKTDDRDLFKFELTDISRFKLDAVPYNVGTGNAGSDLDMLVQLMDRSHNIVGSYNPGTKLSSLADTTLNAGTYFLLVDGKGNQYASEYGSLGSYSVQGEVTQLAPLPVRQLQLKGNADGNLHTFSWIIDADEKVIRQVLQASVDGGDFTALTEPLATARKYGYHVQSTGIVRYRLQVTFDNNRQYYSNVITLRNTMIVRPQLLNNVLTGSQVLVSSPAGGTYAISDYNGKIIARGQIQQGNTAIQAGYLASGVYIIRFSYNGEQYVEKFVKQ